MYYDFKRKYPNSDVSRWKQKSYAKLIDLFDTSTAKIRKQRKSD